MAQASLGPAAGDADIATNDIFTALIIIATAFVYVAAVYAMVRCVTLFESLLPPAGG